MGLDSTGRPQVRL